MALWRVEVAGVSHRFVEAESRAEASDMVAAAILRSLDLKVTAAAPVVQQVYDELAPRHRGKMIAALDGLTSPAGLRDARRARRRLARQIKYDMESREWVRKNISNAPRVADPELIHRLLRGSEAAHARRLRQHLHELNVFD